MLTRPVNTYDWQSVCSNTMNIYIYILNGAAVQCAQEYIDLLITVT